jgi:hypothetical protein
MVEDRANLQVPSPHGYLKHSFFPRCIVFFVFSKMMQATLREANRLLSDQGTTPLVDIGGIVNEDAAARLLLSKKASADPLLADAPQPVPSGAKKVAAASGVAAKSSQIAGSAHSGKSVAQLERAKTPTTTFLTATGWDAEEDDLMKVSCFRLHIF